MTKLIRSFFSMMLLMATGLLSLSSVQAQNSKAKVESADSPTAPAFVLYANANFKTGTGNGFNGADTSIIPTTTPASTTLGIGLNGTSSPQVILGERFTLSAASTISSIVFYPYSTSASYPFPPTTPFTGATVSIWNGRPGSGGAIVATSSTFGGSAWTGIYRVTSTTLTGATRPVMSVTTNFPNTALAAGDYWATFTVTGIVSPGVSTSGFGPPVVNSDATFPTTYPTGGTPLAVQSVDTGVTWGNVTDGGSLISLFVPITVNGTSVTASGVSVSGRVQTSATSRGLTGAIVTLRSQNGTTQTVQTARLGTFNFNDVAAGQTYVVSVSSRRYTFAPRVIQITDSISDLDFVPEQ